MHAYLVLFIRFTEDSKNGDTSKALSYLLDIDDTITYKTGLAIPGFETADFVANGNDWLLAFEMGNGTDYSNAVFIVEDISAVPEPATMLLFGTGLIGLAGFAHRRKEKK